MAIRRRWFWPLVALGTLLEAVAAVTLAGAVVLERCIGDFTGHPPGASTRGHLYVPGDPCADATPWFVATVVFLALGGLVFVAAARRR